MFASVEKIDNKYENEMKNFFRLKKYSNGQKWQSILDEDNSKAFEIEMTRTLINVNRFITKIEIESSRMTQIIELKKEEEKKFKDYLAMGRELLTKLKILATLEKASAMEKYEQSHVRKLSYAATEDTTSGVDTESMIDGHGVGLFSREESFDRRDSRTITLVHKYAATFTKHYEMFDKFNHDVEEIVERFNTVLDFIHKKLQQRTSILINKDEFLPDESKEFFPIIKTPSDEQLEEQTSDDLTLNINADAKSAVDTLSEHFQSSTTTVLFKHINVSGAGHLVEHTYSCIIGSLYTEGKSRKKSKAKEEAATQMIKQIIKRQKSNNLPSHIIPFNELQIHELSVKLTEKEDCIEKLEEMCLHSHEPPPLFTILSETGKNNEPYYAIKCEAMGFTTLGHAATKLQAKKNAAKPILNLVTKRRKSSFR